MAVRTHGAIRADLCGEVVELQEGMARVRLATTPRMAADDRGLVHGGFVFGLADYAAMLAVNHPNVVLAKAEARFLKPIVVGETLVAEAVVSDREAPKYFVNVEVRRGEDLVLSGELLCYTPDQHVLDR